MADTNESYRTTVLNVNRSSAFSSTEFKHVYVRPKLFNQKEVILVLLAFQLCYYTTVDFVRLAVHYQGMSFMLPYIIIYIVSGLPLTLSQLSLGQYGQVGQFQVWKIAPVAYGVGFTMVLLANVRASMEGPAIAYALHYIFKSFTQNYPWASCELIAGNRSLCIDKDSKPNLTMPCCTKIRTTNCAVFHYEYTALHYWRATLFGEEEGVVSWNGIGAMNALGAGSLVISWLAISISVHRGFNKLKNVIFCVFAYVLIFMAIVLLMAVAPTGQIGGLASLFSIRFQELCSFAMWYEVFAHVVESQHLSTGVIIHLGSYASSDNHLHRDILIIGCLKFIVTLYFAMFYFILYGLVNARYRLRDINCLMNTGYGVMFALVPELLTEFPISQCFIIPYFFSVALMSFMHVVLHVLIVVENLQEALPVLRQYRIYIVSTLGVVNVCIGLPMLTKAGFLYYKLIQENVLNEVSILVVLMYSCVVFCIYGVKRHTNDIEFMAGIRLPPFWSRMWYCCTPLLLIPTYDRMLNFVNNRMSPDLVTVNILLTVLFLSPIIIVGFLIYMQHIKQNNVLQMFRRDRSWGPQDRASKNARIHFNPKRPMKYREKLHCKHKCLLASEYLLQEEERIAISRNMYMDTLNNAKRD